MTSSTTSPQFAPDIPARFGSGQAVKRIEDEGLLKGLGRYTDDIQPVGQARLYFVRSPYPHARIVAIDTAAAKAMPGVLSVVTGAELVAAGVKPIPGSPNFKRAGGAPGASPARRVLAHRPVRHVGVAEGLVGAETSVEAEDPAVALHVRHLPEPGDHPRHVPTGPEPAAFYPGHVMRGGT